MTDLPAQTEVPFDLQQTKAVRTDETSVYDYEITNIGPEPRHYWLLVKFDLGTDDIVREGTLAPGLSATEVIECPNGDSANVALEFTYKGHRVQGGAGLIGPLPTIGFDA